MTEQQHEQPQRQHELADGDSIDFVPHDAARQASEATSEGAASDAPRTDDVLGIIAQVDAQLQRIREAQRQQDEGLNSLAERFRRLEQSEREIAGLRTELEKNQQQLDEQRDALERDRRAFDEAREKWQRDKTQREAELAAGRNGLNQREEEIISREERIEQAQAQLADRERNITEAQRTFDERREQLEQERNELNRRVEQAERNVGDLMQQVQSLQERLDEKSRELGAAAEARNEIQREVESARRERDEAHAKCSDLEEQIAKRDDRITEQQQRLELAGGKLAEFSKVLGEQNAQLEKAASAIVLAKQQERQIDELKQQLDQKGPPETAEALRARDAKIAELQRKYRKLQQDAENGANLEVNDTTETLRERVADLERQLEDTRRNVVESGNTDAGLREKVRRVTEVATHIKRRQARLRKMRELLKHKRAGAGPNPESQHQLLQMREAHAQEMRQIDEQRQHLEEVRHALAASEQQMMRRWGRSRSVSVIGWMLVLIAANAVAAWMLTNRLLPAEQTAAISIEPQTRNNRPLAEDEIQRWQAWHAEIVRDETFARNFARRLSERRLDHYNAPESLRQLLTDRLTIDTEPTGRMTYTLAGTNAAELPIVLDLLGSTIAVESNRQMNARGDNAWAVLLNERSEGDGLRYATLNPWTLSDRRWIAFGPIFVACFIASFGIILVIYLRLMRTQRIFEESNAVSEEDDYSSYIRPVM